MFKRLVLMLVLTVTGLVVFPANALGYDWPVKPFKHQHPIRGSFDDPRISTRHIDTPGNGSLSFHFGVDVAASDGTPVYAVTGGLTHVRPNRPTDVAVVSWVGLSKRRVTFGYWHIRPVVKNKQVVQEHQLLGYILAGYGHVHFAERQGKQYVNPLRLGGLTPYRDETKPTIKSVSTYEKSTGSQQKNVKDYEYQALGQTPLSGTVKLVVDTFDRPHLRTWQLDVLAPYLIQWKLVDEYGEVIVPTRTVVDFQRLYARPLTKVYAPGTIQNGPNQQGVYNFWLARRFNTNMLANGVYYLKVKASDIRGNRSTRTYGFEVLN